MINHFSEECCSSSTCRGHLQTSTNLNCILNLLEGNLDAHMRELYFQNAFLSIFVDLNKKSETESLFFFPRPEMNTLFRKL